MSPQTIEAALEAHAVELMDLSGVVGVAQSRCEGQPCIKVFVTEQSPDLEQTIRTILAGVPVVIEETGEIRALPDDPPAP